jgi:hypothetical protein
MSELSPIRERIQVLKDTLTTGKAFTDAQIKWMVRTIELQQDLGDAAHTYINELTVSNLRKDIEIHELREKFGIHE